MGTENRGGGTGGGGGSGDKAFFDSGTGDGAGGRASLESASWEGGAHGTEGGAHGTGESLESGPDAERGPGRFRRADSAARGDRAIFDPGAGDRELGTGQVWKADFGKGEWILGKEERGGSGVFPSRSFPGAGDRADSTASEDRALFDPGAGGDRQQHACMGTGQFFEGGAWAQILPLSPVRVTSPRRWTSGTENWGQGRFSPGDRTDSATRGDKALFDPGAGDRAILGRHIRLFGSSPQTRE